MIASMGDFTEMRLMKSGIFLESESVSHEHMASNRQALVYISTNYPFYVLSYVIGPVLLYLFGVVVQWLLFGRPFSKAIVLDSTTFMISGVGIVFVFWGVVSLASHLSKTIRVCFLKDADLFFWDELGMTSSCLRQMPLSSADAIIIPAQRLVLPKPAFIRFGDEMFCLEQRRPWRQDMAHIRELADFAGLPLIEH